MRRLFTAAFSLNLSLEFEPLKKSIQSVQLHCPLRTHGSVSHSGARLPRHSAAASIANSEIN